MKNKSLFQRYFYICFTMILLSMFILGAIFLVFASQYFKEDKYTLLSQTWTGGGSDSGLHDPDRRSGASHQQCGKLL